MARYGGGTEDFNEEARKLRALREGREKLIASEGLYQSELAKTSGAEEQAARRAVTNRRARTEAGDVASREASSMSKARESVDLDTAAIERNTVARRRMAEESRKLQVDPGRAVRGAQDPLFGRAYQYGQSQYASQHGLRGELGVGGTRATTLQHALQGGFAPAPQGVTYGARAPRDQAILQVEQAEAQLAQATRELTNTRRRASASDEERLAAVQARTAAQNRLAAAKTELSSIDGEAAARRENQAAIQRETARREAVYGATRTPGQLALPAAGQTSDARPGILRSQTRVPVHYTPADDITEGTTAATQARAAQEGLARAERDRLAAMTPIARAADANWRSLTNEQRAAAELTRTRVADWHRDAAAAVNGTQSAVLRSGVSFGTLSQAMHRHGALTSEFIQAAARGETTLRELGNQAVITAGKFGGWTAAATALYGAANAIGRVGQGAMDAQSGVQGLTRVINNVPQDTARDTLANLAGEFNVPINVAGDAVYRMGQRFHDFPSAVQAARAALYSFKTGEVDVATSTDNLVAIVNGFGLQATDLTRVYDQINQAQNTFGIRIGDTEAGLAKAAGTYRNAGGDLNYLLAVTTAIGRATNRSGQEIGTGIARGVNEIRKPVNQARLAAQGVEVDPENFQKTLQSGLKVARTNPNADLQQIASGLFGNQYARLISPVLRDQDTLNQALKDTSPEAAKGSAQRELAKVMGEAKEQVAQLGINLERLGAQLSRSGAFTALGLGLHALNGMLDLAVKLVDVFNELPKPIRQSVVLLGQAAVLLAASRRFGATDKLAGGPLSFLSNPDARAKTYLKRGLRDTQTEAFNELESQARREYRTQLNAATSRQDVESYRPTYVRSQRLPEGDASRLAVEAEMEQREVQARAAQEAANAEARKTVALKRQAVAIEAEVAAVDKLQNDQIRAHIAQRNLPLPRELGAPTTAGVTGGAPIPGVDPNAPLIAGAAANQRSLQGAEGSADKLLAAKRNESRLGQNVARLSNQAIFNTRYALESLTGGQSLGRSYSALESAASTVAGGATRAASFAGRAGTALRGAGAGLGALVGSLGIFDIALLGFVAYEGISSALENSNEEEAHALDLLNRQTNTVQQEAAKRKALQDQARRARNPTVGQRLGDAARGVIEFPLDAATHTELPSDRREQSAQLSEDELKRMDELRRVQAEHQARGIARPQLTADKLLSDIKQTQADRRAGILSMSEFDRQMGVYAVEAKVLMDPTVQQVQRVRQALAAANRSAGGHNYAASLRTLDDSGLQKETQAIQSQLTTFGNKGDNLRRLGSVYAEAVRRYSNDNGAAAVLALQQARDAYYGGIAQEAQDELKQDLTGGNTEGERRAAYTQASTSYRRAFITSTRRRLSRANDRLGNARDARDAAQEALRNGPQEVAGPPGPADLDPLTGRPRVGGFPKQNTTMDKLRAAAEDAKKRYRNLRDQRDTVNKELDAAERKYRELSDELKQQSYDDRQSGRDITLQLQLSGTADTGQQAAIQLRFAQRQANDARKTWGQGSRQYRQALTAVNQARLQIAQSVLADVQADNALLVARAGNNPLAQARAQVEAEQNTLDEMLALNRKNPGTVDSNAIKQQRASVINAENQRKQAAKQDAQAAKQRADQARQTAQQVAALEAQIAQAQAEGDPVAQARIGIQAARRAQASAKGHLERLQALLDLVGAQNQLAAALRDQTQARFDVLTSQTEDPVAQAKIAVRAAQAGLRGTKGTDRLRATATLNTARTGLRNAKVDARVDDVNFALEMDRITNDEAAKQLEQLAQVKGLSKQKKRDLLLQAKRLRDEANGDYELNVGDIQLPSLYEVRRFVKGGQPSGGTQVTNAQQIAVYVNRSQDVNDVASVFEAAMGGSAGAALRNAGLN